MTPVEKAEDLVNKFIQYTPADEDFEFIYAVQCALIAVDEIIASHYKVFTGVNNSTLEYYTQVKNEIQKL